MAINVRAEKVAIESIQPHPSNPRVGDVAMIADSLKINGQYSPIVVWNDTIIAGTHTWKAAKSLGWKEVAITRYEGTERDALKILLADNRTSDIASYHNEYLIDLLKSLPNLDGTGYDKESLDELEGLYADPGGGVGQPLLDDKDPEDIKNVPIQIGLWRGELDTELHGIWLSSVKEAVGDKKPRITRELRARLDVPKEAKPKKEKTTTPAVKEVAEKFVVGDTTLVSLSELQRFPGNPREGDIGAISESLRLFGQYRPIVVNKRTNQILKGNHTAAAAASLGWKEIAVVWVDVDDEAAIRIVLADNRTADKATYDNEILLEVLGKVKTLEGTGFDADDIGDLEKGGSATGPKQPKVKFKVGEYSFSTTEDIYNDWSAGLELPDDALRRLGIPLTSVVTEGR
jgi:ParB-like chromosome segregation protein Spo0J